MTQAAKLLGIGRRTLQRKVKEFGIETEGKEFPPPASVP
jgi:DNA-binding NtrC family response regulator